jgi:glycosidase
VPGIPSIFYGSEYGIYGKRNEYSDYELRPAWEDRWGESDTAKNLFSEISRFSKIRRESEALKNGSYCELLVNYDQFFAFSRETRGEKIIVIINASYKKNECILKIENSKWVDLLSNDNFMTDNNTLNIIVQPSWLRILKKI